MLSKKDKTAFHDNLYALVDTGLFKSVNISESRRFEPHADIHAEEDCDEEEALALVTDILQVFNSDAVLDEPHEVGPHAGGDLYTTSYWCQDFGVTVYFTRSCSVAEAI